MALPEFTAIMSMHTGRIARITAFQVRIPLPQERAWCPEFNYEPLNRGPTGKFDGTYIGLVPLHVLKVEGSDGGPAGWGDISRGRKEEDLLNAMRKCVGVTHQDIKATQMPVADPYVKGVQTALLDWKARREGVPLWKLVGPLVRDRVRVEYWNAFRTPAGAARVAKEASSRGFRGMKLKGSLEIDAPGIVKAVLDAVGPEFKLTIDPNGRWVPAEEALTRARAMAAINPSAMLEDPGGNDKVLRQVRDCGIKTVRSVVLMSRLHECAQLDAADAYNLMGDWPGRIELSAEIHRMGKPLWFGNGLETGLCDLANVHLAATQPACTMGLDLAANMVREDDMLQDPIVYEDGCAVVPMTPGLGSLPDFDAIERYRIAEPLVVEA
jgi:L-alanine-DL-glutamate epimerase-like enolase superfamily enzyme